MVNRRTILTAGGVAVGMVATARLLGPEEGEAAGQVPHAGHHDASPRAGAAMTRRFQPFSWEMPRPPVAQPAATTGDTDLYQIAIKQASAELIPGFRTPVLTFGGQFLGPTIRAKTGRRVVVNYTNNLPQAANVHLHGGHTPADSDGYPMDLIAPGQSRQYNYPNRQQGCTLWYHDHSHGTEAEHCYRGLHGFYLIEDESERALNLPSGDYDVPIMLRDALFDTSGAFIPDGDPTLRTTVLVNGKSQPYFPVAARKYRLRLLNAANERVFRLTLGGGAQMVQIASDGGLLPAPVPLSKMVLSSAQRNEVVVDFGRFAVGTKIVLTDEVLGDVLRFDVVRPATDNSRVPAQLRPLPVLPAATVTRDVSLSFDLSGTPVGLVNGKAFDENRVDFTVKRGATEIWRITNDDPPGIDHTFHLHLVEFQVLDRNGLPPLPEDIGLRDTLRLSPGESVRIKATFSDHLGRYVYHCHFLEHSSVGMMARMDIVP
jgi:spore coat protein A